MGSKQNDLRKGNGYLRWRKGDANGAVGESQLLSNIYGNVMLKSDGLVDGQKTPSSGNSSKMRGSASGAL